MKHEYLDGDLVEGCQAGNAAAQQALYHRYHRKMYGVCLRYTSDRDDAQDVLQEGFIKVFSKIGNFAGRGSLEGWIRRIMVHQAIEHYRKRSRYFMVDIDEAYDVGLAPSTLEALSREEILALVQSLPPGYRTVFNLYVVEGYSHEEIGELLNIAAGTSKSQLSRAKSLLREMIDSRKQREAV